MTTHPDTRLTREEWLQMYQQYPAALAEEVARVLRPLANDEARIQHNAALGRITAMLPTTEGADERLWLNVAHAITQTAIQTGATTDGKAK